MRELPSVVNAPMAGIAGGALAAAVTRAGGLGFIGGGYGDATWVDEQLDVAAGVEVGVGFITWALADRVAVVGRVLDRGVRWLWLSFGDPSVFVRAAHGRGGAVVICQVTSVAEARRVVDAGADVVVAQGHESGGHGRDGLPMSELLPAVVAAVAPVPVFAAGGIGTAADRERATGLGAAGVVVGTRLYASHEALDSDAAKHRLVSSSMTRRTTVFDLLRGPEWPAGHTGRALVNGAVERWHGREHELRAGLEVQRSRYRQSAEVDDMDVRVVWAGTGVSDIHEILPAGDIVRAISAPAAPEQRAVPASTRTVPGTRPGSSRSVRP